MEVFGSFGDNVRVEFYGDVVGFFRVDRDVKEDLWLGSVLFGSYCDGEFVNEDN